MKVLAKKTGYYKHERIYEGTEFDMEEKDLYKGGKAVKENQCKWVELVDENTPAPAPKKKVLDDTKALSQIQKAKK